MSFSKLILLVAVVSMAGCNSGAEASAALRNACTIRRAASMQAAEHPEGKCPSMALLVGAKAIDADKPDAWGTPYDIDCEDDVRVSSAGPDKKMKTSDDIVADHKSCAPFK